MGKQIRIYLADSSTAGVRHAEITNWTGQALACPRARFPELRDWPEVKRPGVYFLFGAIEETGEDAVYIGESEVVLDRLHTHLSGKEFWAELVAFTSKDDHLTKGHVKYLECRLVQLANKAARYRIFNATSPQLPALPRADRDAMEEFLTSIGTLLGVLGHRVLEPLVAGRRQAPESGSALETSRTPATLEGQETPVVAIGDLPVFCLRVGGLDARASPTDEGLVVLAGSHAAKSAQSSLSVGYRALREKLISTGMLVPQGERLQLTRDQLFRSPSQAAAILVGYSINGRDVWRLGDGTTYASYEQQMAERLLKGLDQKI